ncbi:MAG: hypothetical protein AAGC79_16050 [Pseudomonadota bacterium]
MRALAAILIIFASPALACEAPRVVKPFTGEGPSGAIYALTETPEIQVLDLVLHISDGMGGSKTEVLDPLPGGGIGAAHICAPLKMYRRTQPSDEVDWRKSKGVLLGIVGQQVDAFADYHLLYPEAFDEIRARGQFRWLEARRHVAFSWPSSAPRFGSPAFGEVLRFYFQRFGEACGDWLLVRPTQILIPACEQS